MGDRNTEKDYKSYDINHYIEDPEKHVNFTWFKH